MIQLLSDLPPNISNCQSNLNFMLPFIIIIFVWCEHRYSMLLQIAAPSPLEAPFSTLSVLQKLNSKNEAFHDYLTDDSGWWVFQTCFSHVKIRTSQVKHLQILPGFWWIAWRCDENRFGIFARIERWKTLKHVGSKVKQRNLPFKKRPKFLAYWNHQLTHLRKHFLTTFSQPGCLSLKAASVWLPNQAKTIRLPGSEMVSKPESAKECKRLQMSTIFQEPFIEPFWCLSCLVAWWYFKSNQNDISDAWFGDAHSALSSEMFAWKQKTSLLVSWMKLHFKGLSIRVLFPIDQILEYHFRHVSYLSNHV